MSDTEGDIDDLPNDSNRNTENEEDILYDEEIIEEEPLVLRSEDFISGPFCGENSTLPLNILEFDFSYGYDCKRYYNLVVADEKTIIFISGNFINFFNVESKKLTFRRSAFGGGLGHITKNPDQEISHIAIAENGEYPPIIIYEWPTLDIISLLRGGTAKCYTHLNYSPNGELLVSQGGEPDYLITVWNWRKSAILLRTKSYVNDVHRVFFSPYVSGHLTTCGLSHIKFWKMAKTFTGLKLQGELGRFGKTEYSDILGIYPMPDEKVISGCFWGNFLVWEAGLIKLEVFRKLRKRCHDGPIVQFDFRDGELWTVSMDGRIRVWHYDTIDQADPPDDDRVVQLEPIYDFHTPNVKFMCISKRSYDPEDTFYYAQDGNGGIWRIDLTTELNVTPSVQLYDCHAGPVVDIAACPWGTYFVSFGIDGRIYLYNYITRMKLFHYQFPAKGVCMLWLPLNIDPTGNVLILGFDDGNLRVIVLEINERFQSYALTLIQKTKPHHNSLTCMSTNADGNLLVTSGEDKTIFVFMININTQEYISLVPIGLVATTDIVTYITWHKDRDDTVILGCLHGFIDQITLPQIPQSYTTISYLLNVEIINLRFVTYKAQIRRDIKIREIEKRKAEKRERKRVEMENFKKENPGLEVDEEIFLADSESEEQLEPLYIPEIPNKILWIQHTADNTLWLSVGGYDAGYIYEYFIDQKEEIPYKFTMIHDADDVEVSSFVYNYNKKYLIFAMENGAIRINRVTDDFRNLSDYWQLAMHDNYNGYIPRMCFSYDEKYFFTCGSDGNIFSYRFYPENEDYYKSTPRQIPVFKKYEPLYDDDTSYNELSLQQAIIKAEEDRKTNLANYNKKQYLDILFSLRKEFHQLLKRNKKLPPTQIIPRTILELDPRISKDLENKLETELKLVKRKLAFEVEKSEIKMKKLKQHFIDPLDLFAISVQGINNYLRVATLRQRKLNSEFFEMHLVVDKKIIEAELKGRPPERPPIIAEAAPPPEKKKKQLEYFLMGLSQSTIDHKLGAKLNRLLDKYRQRKAKIEKRQQEWEKFNQLQPVPGVNHPDDEAKLEEAMETIGDYKLKSAEDYKVPRHLRESTVKKYKQLLNIREKQFNLRHEFNVKVHKLRNKKARLRKSLIKLHEQLDGIHREIPSTSRIGGPTIVELCEHDFPENNLQLALELTKSKKELMEAKKIVLKPKDDILEKEVLPCLEETDALGEDEVISTWEVEAKNIRLKRKVFEQTETVRHMNNKIESYDSAVEAIYNKRLQVSVDASFLDLHLLTLNQELLILKKSEAVEDVHMGNVHTIMEEMLDMQDLITDQNNKIDTRKREIEVLEEKGKQIHQRFLAAASDNKFYDFLRRIFKKKYKPPKTRDPNDSESDSDSSSSSSSSGDDEDAGSIDSRDVGPIRLDDSVCPKGCDQSLYDLTFQLRSERHTIELEIKEHNRVIECTKKEMEQIHKRMKNIEINLKQSQDALETFQREKQQKLNQVMCTVVLKLHQLQHLISDSHANNVKDTLIFSKSTLSKLYKRVGQLQMETLQQKDKHKLNINHLARMKTDCKHMEDRIYYLNNNIAECMKKKFGRAVDLDEIQEALLKKLIFDLRMSMLDIRSTYEEELHLWRAKFGKKQSELKRSIRDNTARLELLGLLNNEKTKLTRVIQHQEEKRIHLENVAGASKQFKQDITKLKEIVRTQQKELQVLNEEIIILKTKGLQQRTDVKVIHKMEYVEEEEEIELMELDENDDIIEFDYVPALKELQRVSIIPKERESIIMARDVVLEMLEELDIDNTSVKEIESFVIETMKKDSITSIIDELLSKFPYEPKEKEQNVIEIVAEKLYTLKESEVNSPYASEILNTILDKFVLRTEAIEDVTSMLSDIINQLPTSFILQQAILQSIVEKITTTYTNISRDELAHAVLDIPTSQKEEIQEILQHILEHVYGSGIDYMYYIEDI